MARGRTVWQSLKCLRLIWCHRVFVKKLQDARAEWRRRHSTPTESDGSQATSNPSGRAQITYKSAAPLMPSLGHAQANGEFNNISAKSTSLPNWTDPLAYGAKCNGMTNDTVLEFVDGYPELTTTAQTGNGSLVLSNSPTMTNPNLGDATATSLTLGSGVTLGNSSALAQFFITPTAGQLVCIKAVGPPIQLGTSTEVSGARCKVCN